MLINNVKAGYDATTHLLEQGCTRILFVSDNRISNVYFDRHEGYKQALEKYKIPYDKDIVFEDKLNEASGKRTVSKLLKLDHRPDGIFATNDTSAVAIICKLKEAGIKVPEEIAVVGFNNVHISRVVDPSLTTIHYPGMEMGETTATTLFEILNDNTKPKTTKTVILDHKLIIRKSSLRKDSTN